MSGPSEVAILCREIEKPASEIRDRDEKNDMVPKANEELRIKIIKQDMENTELKRRLAYYENPHSPPSGNSIPAQKKKAERRGAAPKGDRQTGPTRKIGGPGVSHHKSSETVKHKADRYKRCGGTNLTHKKIHQKQVTDIEFTVKTVTHCSYESACGCTADSTPEWLKRNSSIGPNLAALGALAWYEANSPESIRKLIGFFGIRTCKRTVQSMIASAAAAMKKEADVIERDLKRTKHGKMDETPIIIWSHRGYVWVFVGDSAVSIHMSHTRSALVPEQRYSFCIGRPVTVDGFAGYNGFGIRQRCWAHILREAEHCRHAGD